MLDFGLNFCVPFESFYHATPYSKSKVFPFFSLSGFNTWIESIFNVYHLVSLTIKKLCGSHVIKLKKIRYRTTLDDYWVWGWTNEWVCLNLLAPKVLLEYLRPMITNPIHPSHPLPTYSIKDDLSCSKTNWDDLRWPKKDLGWSDYILTTFWLHSDYFLTTFWPHSGFILATFRLHSGGGWVRGGVNITNFDLLF